MTWKVSKSCGIKLSSSIKLGTETLQAIALHPQTGHTLLKLAHMTGAVGTQRFWRQQRTENLRRRQSSNMPSGRYEQPYQQWLLEEIHTAEPRRPRLMQYSCQGEKKHKPHAPGRRICVLAPLQCWRKATRALRSQ